MTSGIEADIGVIFATIDKERKHKGITGEFTFYSLLKSVCYCFPSTLIGSDCCEAFFEFDIH